MDEAEKGGKYAGMWGAHMVRPEREPDLHHEHLSIWLLEKGPPYAIRYAALSGEVEPQDFYHRHDTASSIHIIVKGSGVYAVEGNRYEAKPGMIFHHQQGVPHCGPFPGKEGMEMIVIQTPQSGHGGDFHYCPEEGLLDAYGDRERFDAKYADKLAKGGNFAKALPGAKPKLSQRWRDWHAK